ncbi:hypothetical protein [Rhizobium halophytocola]|uniref:Gene transfer agent family protein n=1 Tax=Rhizobium halophytocola TaxID=735519 RepID=A0ABS4DVK8_9HYPH|nr:hypothetical protein [Rhizobium halophytocola]MBP1849695.1 hypothetical protein [Rhizobium halophytocola]
MTNQVRGIITREVAGETLSFRISANEWCELEDELGKTTDQLLKDFFEKAQAEQLDMRYLRGYFRAALSGHRPDITDREAGEIMADMGMIDAVKTLGEVIMASVPQPEPKKAPKAGNAKRTAARV